MTGALVGAVAVIGVLTCLNLLLTHGVIRRLRDHEERLGQAAPGRPDLTAEPVPGTRAAPFVASTTDGSLVTEQSLNSGTAFVGFFSTDCPPCRDQLPRFATAVADRGELALFVINGDGRDGSIAAELLDPALRAGQVVVESPQGPVAEAFGVHNLPTMVVLRDGVVQASSHTADQIPLISLDHSGGR